MTETSVSGAAIAAMWAETVRAMLRSGHSKMSRGMPSFCPASAHCSASFWARRGSVPAWTSAVHSSYLFVAFLALAAGAILYVVGELIVSGRRASWELTLWGIFPGFLIGLATDLILVAAGV